MTGWDDVQSTAGIPKMPSTQFTNPYVGLNIDVDHNVAAATGMIKNGVISNVRTTPRPRNLRSSRSANRMPRTMAINTQPRV